MGTQTRCLILPSTYRDSVALLQLSHTLENLDGVQQAAVMMGTPQNKTLLRQAALLTTEGEQAGDNDLLICVRADTPTSAQDVLHTARQGMAQRWASRGKGQRGGATHSGDGPAPYATRQPGVYFCPRPICAP